MEDEKTKWVQRIDDVCRNHNDTEDGTFAAEIILELANEVLEALAEARQSERERCYSILEAISEREAESGAVSTSAVIQECMLVIRNEERSTGKEEA